MINSRSIFFADASGALLSAVMLGIVLPAYTDFFGMPQQILRPLAMTAGIFCIYSSVCFFLAPKRWQIFLRTIAFLNLGYCCASAIFMYQFWSSLTLWGSLYFLSEKLVVLALAGIELRISAKS